MNYDLHGTATQDNTQVAIQDNRIFIDIDGWENFIDTFKKEYYK